MRVDLRSDTVTRPGAAMRAAMAEAEVGDDSFGDDPTVNALQDEVADLLGHEAALFTPTGTMANQIAVQVLVAPGEELLCDADAHLVTYESGAGAALGGVQTRTWGPAGAAIDPELVAAMVRPAGFGAVPTRAIAVEQTHNRAGGTVIPLATLTALRAVADDAGVALHCDGARLWHAHVADGVPLRDYGRLFDTLSVCLSKGLGAPAGSLVVGSAEHIARATVLRRRFGGSMRQAGILAAAGRYALRHHVTRLAEDHRRAARLAQALAPLGVVDPAEVRTNVLVLDLSKSTVDAATVVAAARERDVLLAALTPSSVRLVTHLDTDDAAVDRAADVLRAVIGG